ncbi:MAG: restriction endonuclease subunit S [Bifidobacterium mongoliense]|uniref:restriction endonuclease subunit S n=1 Tax=Bifidobacterium mongoliense TaxID=518643 RepID=UPI002649D753|nr:restriction endonuclease subunit S [Bifidobacterium mongoliense]MDN6783056.1 restriction endonuclease subunit S [Bifidobacterium mongoliense]
MTDDTSRVPKLRFPGFAGAWEQRKLGGVTDILTGFPFQSQKFSNVGTPLIRGANVKRGYLDLSVNNTVYWGNVHGLERYFLSENDIVIQMDGALIGKSYACIRKENLPSLLVQRVARLRSKGTFPAFIYQSIQRGFLVYIKRKKTETAVPHLSSFDIHNFRITIPSLSEQQRIGIFFGQLDDLITLHRRKLSHLRQLKKGLLQKMFPKSGEDRPEVRFPGFVDAWEQRKLTDISEKVTEKNSDNEFSETLTNSAEYGIISQRDFFDKDISNEKNLNTYYVVRDGDFVYNPRISNFAPVGPIKRNTLGRTGVMSPLYYIFRAHNVDGMYLEKYFSSTKWHRFMELNGDTGARADRFAIKDKDFVQMPIPLPNLEEQSKIARFLENVDNLIALHQRKLSHLQQQKKALLQQMFV